MTSIEDNKRTAWREYLDGRRRLESRPFQASIEITRNCNLKCTMCAQSWSPQYDTYRPDFNMSPVLFERVAKEIFPYLEFANLQGYGETIISPHWLDMLKLCEPFADKLRFVLVTNLSRRHPEMWRKMMGMNFVVHFSCDGATRETYEKIRVGGSFADVLENLAVLQEARRANAKGKVAFHMVVQRMNFREMPLMVDLAARFGADRVSFGSVRGNSDVFYHLGRVARRASQGRLSLSAVKSMAVAATRLVNLKPRDLLRGSVGIGVASLPRAELLDAKMRALQRSKETGVPVSFDDLYLARLGESGDDERSSRWTPKDCGPEDFLEGIKESAKVAVYGRCFKPFSYVVVNYKGDVGLCNHLITDEVWKQMGNLSGSSFEAIWNSAQYQEVRDKLLNARPDNPSCAWCFAHRMTD